MGFFKKKWQSQEEWENSSQGKKFMEKIRAAKEETDRRQREWEANVDPDRLVQYKAFKKIFAAIYIPYSILLCVGFKFGFWTWLLVIGAVGFIVTLLLFYFPPKNFRYRSMFLISSLAFVASVLIAVVCSISEIKEIIDSKKYEKTNAEKTIENNEVNKNDDENYLYEDDEFDDEHFIDSDTSEENFGK